MTGYCLKCKKIKEMKDEDIVTTKNGKSMAKGICPDCGTKICKMLSNPGAEDKIIQ